jgi:hypothetical protein
LLEYLEQMEDKEKLKRFVNMENNKGDTILHEAI